MNRFFLFTEKKEDDRVSRAKNPKYESMSLEELKAKKLASGMEYVLEMMESETIKECYVRREADRYVGKVY